MATPSPTIENNSGSRIPSWAISIGLLFGNESVGGIVTAPALCPSPMKRINYIFIDYENVCPKDLSRVEGRCAQVHLFLGARQERPSKKLHRQIEEHA